MPQRRSATCNRIFLVLASESSLAHCDLGKAEGFWQNQRSEGFVQQTILIHAGGRRGRRGRMLTLM